MTVKEAWADYINRHPDLIREPEWLFNVALEHFTLGYEAHTQYRARRARTRAIVDYLDSIGESKAAEAVRGEFG